MNEAEARAWAREDREDREDELVGRIVDAINSLTKAVNLLRDELWMMKEKRP